MQSNKTLLEIKELSFAYDEQSVLEDINLSLDERDFMAFIGPNGGGKSTLLKLIAKILPLQNGTISFAHRDIKIGYVPQNTNINTLFPIRVFEVVLMGFFGLKHSLLGYSEDERMHAKEMLKKVGMQEYETSPIAALSGGQRQRVMIARALCSSPELLLLDEPTSSIDSEGQREIYELLKSLAKERSIIVVSHDISVVLEYASKAAHINKKLTFHNLSKLQEELEIQPEKHLCEVELLQMLARKK